MGKEDLEGHEVIKEYILDESGLESPVKGRILLLKDGEYYWQISHYWKTKNALGPDVPGVRRAESPEGAKDDLLRYMVGFNIDNIEVVPNKDYRAM